MSKQESYILYLNSKIFKILTNFRFLEDIDQNIYYILKTKHKYEVKSNVSDEILQSFVNYWKKREIPDIRLENINEYDTISQEFDLMKDIIQLFKKYNYKESNEQYNNKEMKRIKKRKNIEYNKKTVKFNQTIEYLFRNKGIDSRPSFAGIKKDLLQACLKEKVKLVDFLTRKKVNKNGLSFTLNEESMTASLFRNLSACGNIVIPRTIDFDSKKYRITSVFDDSFNFSNCIKSIEFSEDSEIRTIGKRAFLNSSLTSISIPRTVTRIESMAFSNCSILKAIKFERNSELHSIADHFSSNSALESITLPSSVAEFGEEWCAGMLHLKEIKIIQGDVKNISYFNDSFIVGKSDIESDTFDVLLFARRNIEKAVIPSFVSRIAPHAFDNCTQIKSVTFSGESKLKSIDKSAFKFSSIQAVSLPLHLSQIGDFAFFACSKLKTVEIPKESELNSIGKFAFSKTSIEKVSIPSKVARIGESAFSECRKLQKATFSEDIKLNVISKSLFSWSSIEKVSMPSEIIQISELAFSYCYRLKSVEFLSESKLKTIGSFAFSNSALESIAIPSCVVEINSCWCCCTMNLRSIKISEKNDRFSFFERDFIIGKSNEKSGNYDIVVAAPRNVRKAVIPSCIKRISPYAFQFCIELQKVEFSKHSELISIEDYSFSSSSLKSCSIPSNVKAICEFAFFECKRLNYIEIPNNSKLAVIGQFAFSNSALKCFFVPSHVIKIGDFAFSDCQNLQIIEISENSELHSIRYNFFSPLAIPIFTVPANSPLQFIVYN